MRNCPSELKIALFASKALTIEETKELQGHLMTCHECAHLLADVMAIESLDSEGLLPRLTANESLQISKKIKKVLQAGATKQAGLDSQSAISSRKKGRLRDFIGGILGVTTSSELGRIISGAATDPILAEKKSDSDDRNLSGGDSLYLKQIETEKVHPTNTENIMADQHDKQGICPAPSVIGEPGVDGVSPLVQQSYEDTCAIRCQELILRDFGMNVSEIALRDEACRCGWYQPGGGTQMQNVGNLLEIHDISVHRYEDANIFTLAGELAKGHKVIIGVDSGELWNKGLLEWLGDRLGLSSADHALLVSGIDTSDPDNVQVILTDPGSGDVAKAYPIDQFVDAWKDSNCFMVATTEPAPHWLPEMANFDYTQGHLPAIGAIPFDQFQEIQTLSAQVPEEGANWHTLCHSFADAVGGSLPGLSLLHQVESYAQIHEGIIDSHPDHGHHDWKHSSPDWHSSSDQDHSIDNDHHVDPMGDDSD